MNVANHRSKEHNTVHHLVSRIAHRVYFLREDERNDFLAYVRRATEFSGLRLIGWCIMTNHFHLLVFLPERVEVDEDEVLRRYAVLKGKGPADTLRQRLATWRTQGKRGEDQIDEALRKLRRRMYNVGEYMRTIKKWFTEEYNRRTEHKGTMWESVYHDKIIPFREKDIREVLAYIHLNPIRAAITDRFDAYPWSSFTAFRNGDMMAMSGMRFAYEEWHDDEAISAVHFELMREKLEAEKLKRAMDIARKRAAGLEAPCDHLTNEALVVQATAQLQTIRKEITTLGETRRARKHRVKTRDAGIEEINKILEKLGPMRSSEIIDQTNLPPRTAYRYPNILRENGKVEYIKGNCLWCHVAKQL